MRFEFSNDIWSYYLDKIWILAFGPYQSHDSSSHLPPRQKLWRYRHNFQKYEKNVSRNKVANRESAKKIEEFKISSNLNRLFGLGGEQGKITDQTYFLANLAVG